MQTNYHNVIRENSGIERPETEEDLRKQEQQTENAVIKRTLIVQWNSDAVTQDMFKHVTEEITSLESTAREKACSYAVHNNHQEIINLLVRAAELRKLKSKYVSSNN